MVSFLNLKGNTQSPWFVVIFPLDGGAETLLTSCEFQFIGKNARMSFLLFYFLISGFYGRLKTSLTEFKVVTEH